ncbi:MAG: bifunctional metallophosphatase/5'-nucleotidase [Candidatus Zixiibacteriota bacterium]
MRKAINIILAICIFIPAISAYSLQKTFDIVVFYNNDRHGGIAKGYATFMNPETPPPLGKYASEAMLIKKYRELSQKHNFEVMILDQGDIWQGAPVGTLTDGEAVIHAYNLMQPDAVIVGNHEFDSGAENMDRLIEMADFPILACNLFVNEEETKLYPGVKPYIIKEYDMWNGDILKVGIIGLTTQDTKGMSLPGNTDILTVGDEIKYAQMYSDSLKKLGCDFIILSAHVGLPFDAREGYLNKIKEETEQANPEDTPYKSTGYLDIASEVEGVDVAFGGHIHVGYHEPWEDPNTHMMVFQNYGHGTGTGAVRFKFDPESKVFMGYEPIAENDALITLFSDDFWPDPDVDRYVDSLAQDAEKHLETVIAKSEGLINRGDATSNKVGHIICDAIVEASGCDVANVNMGGVRASLPSGSITKKDVFTVMPFDNKIVVVQLSGKDLKAVIERMAGKYGGALIGGARIKWDSDKPEGERIVSFKIDGQEVQDDKQYEFGVNDYIFHSYGIPQLKDAPDDKVKHTGILLRTAIEDWLKKHSPISPGTDDRWVDVTK